MARAREGGTAVTVGMIAFAALWAMSTVFLVILYTGQEDLNNEIAQVRTENAQIVSSQERRSIELVKSARAGGPTVVGLMEQARADTALLATGDPADDPGSVRAKRDQVLSAIRDDGLVKKPNSYEDVSLQQALGMLYEAYRTENALRTELAKRAGDLEVEVTRLVEENSAMKTDFEARAAEMTASLTEAERARESFRTERDASLASIEQEFAQVSEQNTGTLTKERQLRQECEVNLAEAQERFRVLRRKLGDMMVGPEELATVRTPDGKILTAVPGDEVVYVDLGRRDGLTLGLQFAVYSADTGIPVDGRSKAQVEVVSINATSAECRIVRQGRNQVILSGDLIANPIYDPSRPMVFVVTGSFDLNRDGVKDSDGAGAVASLVRNWGGTVSPELTPLTDFVVVGTAPRRPRPDSQVAPDRVELNRSRREAWDAYTKILSTAQNLSIPMMTQEVFLNFLGYSDRYAGR